MITRPVGYRHAGRFGAGKTQWDDPYQRLAAASEGT